jgi:membrane-associated phospholipid phosphatase
MLNATARHPPEAPAQRLFLALLGACLLAAGGILLQHLDRPIFLAVNAALARVASDTVLMSATILGQGQVAVALLTPALWRAPRVMAAGLFATPLALLLTHVPKRLLGVPRPSLALEPGSFHQLGIVLANHNSMPSGHAITAFLVAGVVVFGSDRAGPRLRVALPLALAALLVAASRIGVGAHWPSDVLVGAALGGASGLAGAWLAGRWRGLERRGGRLLMIGVAAAAVGSLWFNDLGYPLAVPLQRLLVGFGLFWCGVALRQWLRARPGPGAVP